MITGADSGIGQATAIAFAQEGADVVINYLDGAVGTQETKTQVEAAGRKAIVVQADIGDKGDAARIFDEAVATFGHVDILMNNASVDASGTYVADLGEHPDEACRRAP